MSASAQGDGWRAPTVGTATALDGAARVAFTPGALAYGTLVNHTADCGGKTASGTASPITVAGLANDTFYTCKVRTTSTIGTGPWSAASNTVMPVEAAVVYFHNDISGSPMLATDASGAVLWKENYRPYGERLNNQASGTAAQTGFTGKPFDAATGLSYMGARYYNPMLGRFMGVDPVDFKESNIHSFNRYAYANNNPYRYIDPDGRQAVENLLGKDAPIVVIGNAFGALAAYAVGMASGNESLKSVALQGMAENRQANIEVIGLLATTGRGNTRSALESPLGGTASLRNGHLAGGVHPKTGVPFDRAGYPDFSGVAKAEVTIKQTGSRAGDFRAANDAAGLNKTPEGYTWHHHQDGKTMQLVPRDIHSQTGHTGGFNSGQ